LSAVISKWMIALSPHDDAADVDLDAWVDGLPSRTPGLKGLEIEHLDVEAHRAHTRAASGSPRPPQWTVIVCLWTENTPPPDLASLRSYTAMPVKVSEHCAFDLRGDLRRTGTVAGFKKTTFWKAPTGVAATVWQKHYRDHVPSVRTCHSAWAYRQNLIREKPASCPYDAVSENWWATETDLCERFFTSAAGQRTVAEEVARFIDGSAVSTLVTRHRIIVTPPYMDI
jgi:hypothetical protein